MTSDFHGVHVEELQQLNASTSPVGKMVLVQLVYSGEPACGAVAMALESRKLIDVDGVPTALGRRFADFLTGGHR